MYRAVFSPEMFLHLVQNEQMSVGKKITHGADKFTLGACHLVWIAVCTKILILHLVVWQWYKFTHGGSPFINVTLGARTKCV